MFVYDHRSPIQGATSQILPTAPQLLFPFMNFTCSGSITRLMFVASGLGDSSDGVINWSWRPVFSLWHRMNDGDNFVKRSSMGIFNHDQPSNQPARVTDVGLVEINFTTSISFEAGDILGLRQQFSSHLQRSLPMNIGVLRQRGGYGLTLMCTSSALEPSELCPDWEQIDNELLLQQIPYIAIETSKTMISSIVKIIIVYVAMQIDAMN